MRKRGGGFAMDSELVEVFAAGGMREALVVKGALECAGIEVVVANENLQAAMGDIPPSLPTFPRIMVKRSDVARAAAIIRAANQRHHEVRRRIDAEWDEEDEPAAPSRDFGRDFEDVGLLGILTDSIKFLFAVPFRILRFFIRPAKS